ncbi:MAG: hypothetical protein Q7R49_03015 [Candidatus Daviesbacteria bacterium]|nr:hypothetical protein [Candidatus Daviesbacteria bacterium]
MTTTRMLFALVIGAAILVGGMIYYRYRAVSQNLNNPFEQITQTAQNAGSSLTGNTSDKRLTSLEDAVALLITRVNNSSAGSGTGSAAASGTVDARVQSLENTVANLQVQINQLKGSGAVVATTTTGTKSPIYIPLGWNGAGSTQDWSSVTSQSISIDPADYSGYTSMQFSANISVYQGNGTAYARLYDSDDGLAIIPSQVSGTTDTPVWADSTTFKLPSTAKKTYILQVKTTTGYASQVQNARIKVNF